MADEKKDDDTSIKINLTCSMNNINYEELGLLQVEAEKRLNDLLTEFVTTAQEPKKDNNENNSLLNEIDAVRVNNTILIQGQRGAGKTTFLKKVLREKLKDTEQQNILPIAFIDPTLTNTNEHILVDIIARFKHVLDEKLPHHDNSQERQQFNKALEEMGEGLKLLRSISCDNTDKDVAWFLNKALKHSTGGQTLEAKFRHLIDVVAKILNYKLFIIAIDDVDNDTTKAYDVLELIRRYLTHPRLAVIISGDPKMYSHIVQQRKHHELTSTYTTGEASSACTCNTKGDKSSCTSGNEESIKEKVVHLEQQYLAKVLPTEQRILLRRLGYLTVRENQEINLELAHSLNGSEADHKKKVYEVNITKCLDDMFAGSLNLNRKELPIYTRFFLDLPVRSVLQILKSTADSIASSECEHNSCLLRTKLINSIEKSYLASLCQEQIYVDKLVRLNTHQNAFGEALFTLGLKHDALETVFYVTPTGSRESYRVAQLFLAQVMASYLCNDQIKKVEEENQHSIGHALKLMLTCGASATVYTQHFIDELQTEKNAQYYLSFIGLNQEQSIASFACRFTPFIITNKHHGAINAGIVRLSRHQPEKKDDEKENENKLSINQLAIQKEQEASSFSDYLAATTLCLASHSMLIGDEEQDYLSAYSLLASLAALLTYKENDISVKLSQLSAMKTFVFPSFIEAKEEQNHSSYTKLIEPTENTNKPNEKHAKDLTDLIKRWRTVNKQADISPLLIGRIWSRISYSQANVCNIARQGKELQFGKLVSRLVWAIINAALIEEVRYAKAEDNRGNAHLIKDFAQAKNIADSPAELSRNLENSGFYDKENESSEALFKHLQKRFPITSSLLSCPLLWPFLKDSTDNTGKIDDYSITYNLKNFLTRTYAPEPEIETNTGNEQDEVKVSTILEELIAWNNEQDVLALISRVSIHKCSFQSE